MRYSMLFLLLGIVYSGRFESQAENQLRKPATNPASAATLTAHQATPQTHKHTRDVPAPTPSPSPAQTTQTMRSPSTGPTEQALGPVTVFNRGSASENPSATLAHHLQDSTHISFGVLTTGFTYRWFKLEGSIFNGREPNENRYNFDAHKWNSRSGRLWFMPNSNWAVQVSHGFLRSPENQEPNVDIRRTTASVQYNKPFIRGNWASAFVWGRNHASKPGKTRNLNGYTAESTAQFLDKNYVIRESNSWTKTSCCVRPTDFVWALGKQNHPSFRIGAYTFGRVRDVWTSDKVRFGIGSDLTFYSMPSELDAVYGKNPISWKLFFRIRPGKMTVHSSHGRHNANETVKPIH